MNPSLPTDINPQQVTERFWKAIDHLVEQKIIEGLHFFCKPFNKSEFSLKVLKAEGNKPPDDYINYLVLRFQVNPLFLWHGQLPIILPDVESESEN